MKGKETIIWSPKGNYVRIKYLILIDSSEGKQLEIVCCVTDTCCMKINTKKDTNDTQMYTDVVCTHIDTHMCQYAGLLQIFNEYVVDQENYYY